LAAARILWVLKSILDRNLHQMQQIHPIHPSHQMHQEQSSSATTNVEPIVRLSGATVRFAGGAAAVWQGLNVALHAGECLTLLGPSGCGKSTVLRVMAGLQALSGGEMHSRCSRPAFVFQEAALLPWANLQDNVALPLKVRGVPPGARREQVQQVLTRVGLAGRERALPHELSGGMKMRASIARALVMAPDLLLMDEPFAALDDPTRQRLQTDLLQWWQAQGFALCFVTHQVAEAVFMSSRIVVMGASPARVVAEFTVDEPYPRTPAFRRSASFHSLGVQIGDALAQSSADAQEGGVA
jgi:NitT/TauT family transport system ATP-binding protein